MTQPGSEARDETQVDTAALLASVGIEVTDEGRARWRQRLAEARATAPERHARLRAQLGLPDRPSRSA